MMLKKKNRFKPLYKKFILLRENIQNRSKLLSFKKQKWKQFIENYKQKLKRYKKYKPKDQKQLIVSRYLNKYTSYKNRYKTNLLTYKQFNFLYGLIKKKQMKQYFKKNQFVLNSLENRLDTVLYRAKFCNSLRNARQLISHKKITVNGYIIKTKSFFLKPGDLISVKSKNTRLVEKNIIAINFWPIPPKHLYINYKTMQIVIGNINNTNLSTLFSVNLNTEKLLNNYNTKIILQ